MMQASFRPHRFVLLVAALLGLCALLPSVAAAQSNTPVVDEIVAVVGDKIILRSDVDGYVMNLVRQQQVPYSQDLWVQALNQLIDQQVMSVVAKRDTTIVVSDDQVEQALTQRVDEMVRQVGSEAKLEELYGKSLLQVKADLRDEFRDQLLAEQLQRRKMGQIKVTPSEVKDWFAQFPTDSLPTLPEMVRVSHVVRYPSLTAAAKAEARGILTTIRDSIVTGGADFEEMARQFSDDPGSATAGGHIEDTQLGDLVPEFAAVASRVPIGEVSQVFESPFGYHILRVNERRGDVIDFNHILITIDDSNIDPAATVEYLSTLRDSVLTQNVPFELIAKRHSEEAQSAAYGGRVMDPRTGERDLFLESLGPTWQMTLDTLEIGEVSTPAEVELLNGRRAYHIVLLQKRVPSHRWNIETDYARIEQYALQEKRARELEQWLQKLRKDVYVDLRGKAEALSVAQR